MEPPSANYPAPAPGLGLGAPRMVMGAASIDEASIMSKESLQAVSCRYSSWCTGRQLVVDPGPLSRLHKTAAWHEIEEQCESLEAADLRITEIDLSFADENNQSLRFEFADVSMRGGTHARARDWGTFALDEDDVLEGEEEGEEEHSPGDTLSGHSATGLKSAGAGGPRSAGSNGFPVPPSLEIGGSLHGGVRALNDHHSQQSPRQPAPQQSALQQQLLMHIQRRQQQQRSGPQALAQAEGRSGTAPAASEEEEEDDFGEYGVNTPLRSFHGHPHAGLPALPHSASSPALTRLGRNLAGQGGAVAPGGNPETPTRTPTRTLTLPLAVGPAGGTAGVTLEGQLAGAEGSSWSGSGSGSWSESPSGSGTLTGTGKSLGFSSRMGSTPGSATEKLPPYQYNGESTVAGGDHNSTDIINGGATAYLDQTSSGRYLVQPGGRRLSTDVRPVSASCRYTSNKPQAPVAFAQIVSQQSDPMSVGQLYSSPWTSEASADGPDPRTIYEMQGDGLKSTKGVPGERRFIGWRLPHAMNMPTGRKPNEPLLKKLVESSKRMTKKMAGVLVRG